MSWFNREEQTPTPANVKGTIEENPQWDKYIPKETGQETTSTGYRKNHFSSFG